MLEKTKGAIKNGQSRDIGRVPNTGRRQTELKTQHRKLNR
jgi:hypothetical protein